MALESFSANQIYENPSDRSQVLCGQTDGQTDITKVTGAFRNFCENRLEQPLGEVYFKSQKYPLNAHCDLNYQIVDDEADGTDNHNRTKRSCGL